MVELAVAIVIVVIVVATRKLQKLYLDDKLEEAEAWVAEVKLERQDALRELDKRVDKILKSDTWVTSKKILDKMQ